MSELHGRGLTLRDIGIAIVGHVPLGNGWRIENAVSLTNGAGMGVQADDDDKKSYFGKVNVRYKDKEKKRTYWAGISGASGTMPDREGIPLEDITPTSGENFEFNRFGVDFEVDTRSMFFASEFALGWEKDTNVNETEVLDAWYVLIAKKTRWNLGPLVRHDRLTDEYSRWTAGMWYGAPHGKLRLLGTYELVEEDGEPKDDRALLWLQVEF